MNRFFKHAVILAAFALANTALAATDPAKVDQIDRAREGNLAKIVADFYTKNSKSACEEPIEVSKVEVFKTGSSSLNEEKVPGTPYTYTAQYLVVQKCHSGSTFGGAYTGPGDAVLIKASFTSKYNEKGGPAEMKNLYFQILRPVDLKAIYVSEQ